MTGSINAGNQLKSLILKHNCYYVRAGSDRREMDIRYSDDLYT